MRQTGCIINGRTRDVVEERWEQGCAASAVLRIREDCHPGTYVTYRGWRAIVVGVTKTYRHDGPMTEVKLNYFPQRPAVTDAVEILAI